MRTDVAEGLRFLWSRGLLTIASGLIAALTLAPMALTNDVMVIGALLAGAIFLLPAGNASVSSYLVAFTPDHLQGRTQSALYFAGGSLMPFGAVVGGAMLAWFGAEAAMFAAAILVVVSVLPLLLNAEVRSLPRPDRWDVAAA